MEGKQEKKWHRTRSKNSFRPKKLSVLFSFHNGYFYLKIVFEIFLSTTLNIFKCSILGKQFFDQKSSKKMFIAKSTKFSISKINLKND